MIESLKDQMLAVYKSFPEAIERRRDWLLEDSPAQCIQVVETVKWTERCTQAIASQSVDAVADLRAKYLEIVNHLVQMVRMELNLLHRTLICTLLITNVHLMGTLEELTQVPTATLESFEW